MTIVAVTSMSETEDQYSGENRILKLVLARLDGSSWFGGVGHLANERSLLVLEIRDGVIVLEAMSTPSLL
jgi:hypothetical protein